MAIASINPATGETLRSFEPLSEAQIEEKLERAAAAFRSYRNTTFADRGRMTLRAAEILEAEKEKFGRLITTEMGKPLRAAIEEVAKCAWNCRFYAENAAGFLADEVIQTSATRSFIRYQPLGPVLAIMPWNFPFWQVFRFAAPALMAGNVCLLKHASNAPQCALTIEEIFRRAGFPEDVFQTLLIGSDQVERALDNPRVVAVTLTGSASAGCSVASKAGERINTRRQFSQIFPPIHRPILKSCSVRSHRFSARAALTKRSGWPTTQPSVWPPAPGQMTRRSAIA
jgi:succinate-semialdehyde dehydrogenase/glutarate-semialdehyde dehydrogenase